jgi:hypothetical protein
MNKWVKKSIELAHSKGYLDKLFEIYPVEFGEPRMIPNDIKNEIQKAFEEENKIKLIEELLKLDKFPINHPYVPSLKRHRFLLLQNPQTVERISKILFSLGFDKILELSSQPKSPSRQLGYSFKQWLRNQRYSFLEESEFKKCSDIAFLEGSDEKLKKFAKVELKISLTKGVDFILKIKNKFFLGEAKFLTDYGGTQDNQFREAIKIAKIKKNNIIGIAVLDGIVWFKSNCKMHQTIKSFEGVALSALLLKEFIKENFTIQNNS